MCPGTGALRVNVGSHYCERRRGAAARMGKKLLKFHPQTILLFFNVTSGVTLRPDWLEELFSETLLIHIILRLYSSLKLRENVKISLASQITIFSVWTLLMDLQVELRFILDNHSVFAPP